MTANRLTQLEKGYQSSLMRKGHLKRDLREDDCAEERIMETSQIEEVCAVSNYVQGSEERAVTYRWNKCR
jgi:hypothetical protein